MPRLVLASAGIVALGLAFAMGMQRGRHDASISPTGGARAELVRAALEDPDPLGKTIALAGALRGMSLEEVDDVVVVYEGSFGTASPDLLALTLLSEVWASLDPLGALARIEGWPAPFRPEARNSLLRAWARLEPRVALSIAEDVEEDLEGWALHAVYNGWAESGDPEIWNFVMTLPAGMDRESASIPMMQSLIGQQGFDALFERVEALPSAAPDRFKLAAFRTAAALVAEHDPGRALAFAKRHTGGPYERGLLRRVAVRWVWSDPLAAMDALLNLEPSGQREWALEEAYRTWVRWDRPSAMAWMGASPPSDPRLRPLLDIHAKALANDDPDDPGTSIARAIAWCEAIEDAEKRREALLEVGVTFLNFDPPAARPWLDGHGIRAEVGSELRRRRRLMGRGGGATPQPM